eukprot:6174040-Pleurochrysis_carterae.AAC.1
MAGAVALQWHPPDKTTLVGIPSVESEIQTAWSSKAATFPASMLITVGPRFHIARWTTESRADVPTKKLKTSGVCASFIVHQCSPAGRSAIMYVSEV